MITIYSFNETNFDNLGLGVLEPSECTIEEEGGGMYEVDLVHPIDDGNKHNLITVGRLLKVPTPYKDGTYNVPMPASSGTSKTYQVWECTVNKLYIRSAPNGTAISSLAQGEKYQLRGTKTIEGGGIWHQMATYDGRITGYVYPNITSSSSAAYAKNTGQTITVTTGVDNISGTPTPIQMDKYQLFRIYEVMRDAVEHTVEARARHITYDLGDSICTRGSWSLNVYASQLYSTTYLYHRTDGVLDNVTHVPDVSVVDHLGVTTGKIGLAKRNLMEIAMGSSGSILTSRKCRIVRNNRYFHLFPNLEAEPVYEVRYGKNMLSAALKIDISELANIIVGSATINSSATIKTVQNSASIAEYGRKAVLKEYGTLADLNELQTKMNEEFTKNKVQEPKKTLDAEFVKNDLSPRFAEIAKEHDLHIYDVVRVYDPDSGIDINVRMNGYTYNVLKDRYDSITLGDLEPTS